MAPKVNGSSASAAPFGVGSARTVPMKIIVCGLSRTGTTSIQNALKILGIPAYHSNNLVGDSCENMERWIDAIDAKYNEKGKMLSREDFDKLLGNYMGVVDLPGAFFGPELAALYPDAKVVILNRDPESWFRSCQDAFQFRASSLTLLLFRIIIFWDVRMKTLARYLDKIQSDAWKLEWHDQDAKGKALEFFHSYYAECRARIPAENRLEFSVQDGWEPLCKHLGVEIPTVRAPDGDGKVVIPFPRANDAVSFKQETDGMASRILMGGVYAWVGRAAIVTSLLQTAYLSREFWFPWVTKSIQFARGLMYKN